MLPIAARLRIAKPHHSVMGLHLFKRCILQGSVEAALPASSLQKAAGANHIDNLLFDFVSVLHAKAEGLEACEKYLRDAEQQNYQACIEMLNRIIEQDRQMVIELKDHLADMFQKGDHFERSHEQSMSAPH